MIKYLKKYFIVPVLIVGLIALVPLSRVDAAVALVANTIKGSAGGGSTTTTGINTTGSTLIVMYVTYFNGATAPTISDSNGNTWHPLTTQVAGSKSAYITYAYDHGGTALSVGSGHTFTITCPGASCFPGVAVEAFSGTLTSSDPFDQQNGAASNQAGSITPSQNNEVLVTGSGNASSPSAMTIDQGFTITDQLQYNGGNYFGTAAAYLIQTTATAQNPTWSSGVSNSPTSIASFKVGTASTPVQQSSKVVLSQGQFILSSGKYIQN